MWRLGKTAARFRRCKGFGGVTTARSSRACEMALRHFGAGCTNGDGRAGPPDVGRVAPRNTRGLSNRALREAGREVNEAGLLDASKLGDVPLCTLYLDAGVPIDCVDGEDSTPLHLACRDGHLSLATLLLDRGSRAIDEKITDCVMTSGDGETPLHLACRNGHVSLATLLLDRGSRAIDEKTSYGRTPLYLACREGHLSVATLLLDRGSCALDMGHCLGTTPLHVACREGHLSVATLLLDRGSRAIDKKNSDDETPLYLACYDGHLSLAKLLLDRGSRAIDEKAWHETPFQVACSRHRNHVALMRLLLDRGCYLDMAWWRSLRNQHSQEVAELVEEYGGCGASQGCS